MYYSNDLDFGTELNNDSWNDSDYRIVATADTYPMDRSGLVTPKNPWDPISSF